MSQRREFLQRSATLLAGGVLASSIDTNAFSIFKNRIAPSDQLNIGVIGIKGMGWANVKAALKVADRIASAPQLMDNALWNETLETYSETELVDIVLFSCFTTGSRVAIILGVEPGPEASSRIFYPTPC